MRPSAFVGALVGAALGALVWAGVGALTGLEIGWIAWGVGGAIGFGAALGGGDGPVTGAVCAILAVVAILAGKWMGINMIVDDEIRKVADQAITLEMYQEMRLDAEVFAGLLVQVSVLDYGPDASMPLICEFSRTSEQPALNAHQKVSAAVPGVSLRFT